MTIDWEHFYVLGWYDSDGRAYLSTWNGDLPIFEAVVTGGDPPLWKAPVPPRRKIHAVPLEVSATEYATSIGGVRVIGWYIEKGFERQ